MKICTLLSNGFEEVEAIATIALLKRSGLEVDIYALNDTKASGKHDLVIANLIKLDDVNVEDYDALLLPGGPHYVEMEASVKVKDIITRFMNVNKLVCGICAAPTILGHMGYLKNKNYTCFTSMDEDFGGTYVDKYVVTDGNLITARSAAASIDFAFAIINYLQGETQEKKIKDQIYY